MRFRPWTVVALISYNRSVTPEPSLQGDPRVSGFFFRLTEGTFISPTGGLVRYPPKAFVGSVRILLSVTDLAKLVLSGSLVLVLRRPKSCSFNLFLMVLTIRFGH